jgi:hypothetical protein
MADITLKCHCGRMRGTARAVSPSAGFRFFCYCKDCQAFARFLERPDILDAAGGTDIFQMPPVQVTFTAGFEALRCVRLSSKVLRWYADCCRTPIANTAAGPRFPVVALIHSIMDCAADELSRIALLGPPLCRIYERSAIGPLPSNAAPPPSLRVFAYRATKVVGWWMRGLARPNPFFDERTKAPRSVPHLLSRRVDWR